MCKGLATLPATCLKSAKDIKHKIGFLLQKPEFPTDQKQVKEKTTAVKRVSPADVEKWKLSFNNLMNCESGRTVFTAFLKSELSQENLEFWNACEEYKKSSPNKMAAKAKEIYEQYIEADSPNEVNLDSATREETRQNLSIAGLSCFNDAQQKIFNLMEKDSYRRFLHSKLIQDLSLLSTTTSLCALKKIGGKIGCSENRCGA
ncbi:regulator of G-protein signaling 4 [Oncorhynchus kisutch]|uniref:Regulator of G protein signaling 4 n=1 Tax=Oncorhynchus kisutch TaxID=8019 RepID=A0A8C7N844_ONCKI|nr:regulator of G-protein signaling 4-like [Oncorhynchus kisutch]